jgi:hypothetical protein
MLPLRATCSSRGPSLRRRFPRQFRRAFRSHPLDTDSGLLLHPIRYERELHFWGFCRRVAGFCRWLRRGDLGVIHMAVPDGSIAWSAVNPATLGLALAILEVERRERAASLPRTYRLRNVATDAVVALLRVQVFLPGEVEIAATRRVGWSRLCAGTSKFKRGCGGGFKRPGRSLRRIRWPASPAP